jgi:hypothetical protein
LATQQTVAALDPVLKDIYGPAVIDQLNNEIAVFQLLDVTSENLVGRDIILGLHTSRSGGVGARDEGDALPVASAQTYQKAIFNLKYLYGRGQVTGPAIVRTRDQIGSMVSALRDEMTRIRDDLLLDTARQTYGDSTGYVETCGTTTTSNTVVLAGTEACRKGFLYVNQLVDIGTAGNPVSLCNAVTITNVDPVNGTITVSGAAISTTNANFVSIAGSRRTADGSNKEMDGLRFFINPTANVTVGGINPASAGNTFWDNQRDSSGTLSLDNLRKWTNIVRVNGGKVGVALTSFGVQRQIYNLFQTNIRYVGDDVTKLRGGFEAVSFDGYPIVADRLAPFGKLFFIDKRYLKLYAAMDWQFLDQDGHALKWVIGKDAYEFALARYANFGITRRNVHLVATGFTDTTGI